MVELLLQAYPEALSVNSEQQRTPLDVALTRVNTTQLSASDSLITLLTTGGSEGNVTLVLPRPQPPPT